MVWAGTALLAFITVAELSREEYLADLGEQKAKLDRDLWILDRKNRREEKLINAVKAVMGQEKARKEIEIGISDLRKLPFSKPVVYRRMARAEIKQYIISKLGAQYTTEEFHNYELSLKRIGLLPMDVDLVKMVTELLSEQVAAFYDPDTHELYTFAEANLDNNFERTIMAHELVHALQDQNFNFKALALRAKDNDDAASAASALVEGDATYHMGVFLRMNYKAHEILGDLQLLFSQQNDKMYSAPPFLRDSLLFPYQDGQIFVSEVHAHGGNSALDAMFANPPQSTEQVLHPEKYIGPAFDPPVAVSIDIKPRASWKKLHENTVGEMGLRSLFTQRHTDDAAAVIAQGWGGDRYVLYETEPGKWVLIWKTVWDSEKDAREFFDGMDDFYRYRYQAPGPLAQPHGTASKPKPASPSDAVLFSVAKQKQCITIRGKTVLFLDAPDAKTIHALLDEFHRLK